MRAEGGCIVLEGQIRCVRDQSQAKGWRRDPKRDVGGVRKVRLVNMASGGGVIATCDDEEIMHSAIAFEAHFARGAVARDEWRDSVLRTSRARGGDLRIARGTCAADRWLTVTA